MRIMDTNYYPLYEPPVSELIDFKAEGMICASGDGITEGTRGGYESGGSW